MTDIRRKLLGFNEVVKNNSLSKKNRLRNMTSEHQSEQKIPYYFPVRKQMTWTEKTVFYDKWARTSINKSTQQPVDPAKVQYQESSSTCVSHGEHGECEVKRSYIIVVSLSPKCRNGVGIVFSGHSIRNENPVFCE